MKLKFTILLLLLCCSAFSQDTIITYRGGRYPATILAMEGDSIRYKRTDFQESIDYYVPKYKVWEIRHGNKTSENFFTEAEKSLSLDDIKKQVLDLINGYGYEEDSDRQKYLATFEGNYLRLAIMKKDKVKSKGFLFDFSHVYQFHPVSNRGESIAYVNIYVSFLDNPKKMKWAKQKLIMRVHGHKEANEIMRALQCLNRILRGNTIRIPN